MMEVEAIVLNATAFAERDRVITLFSEGGLLKCFVKLPYKPQLTRLALTTPFTKGQYFLRPTKTNLYRFEDGTCLDQHLGLRASLKRLETAQKIAAVLLASQWQNKPTPSLYRLAAAFLKRVSETDQNLLIPFLIKLLKHEGDLSLEWLSDEEKVHFLQIANTRHFQEFQPLPLPLEEKIYSKVTKAFAASI